MTLQSLIDQTKGLSQEELNQELIMELEFDGTSLFSTVNEVFLLSEHLYIGKAGLISETNMSSLTPKQQAKQELYIKKGEFVVRGKGPMQTRIEETTESLIKQTAGFSVPHLKMELE